MRILFGFVLLLVSLFSQAQTGFKLEVQTRSEQGNEVESTIELLNTNFSLNSEKGKIVFNQLPAGTYTVYIRAEGFASQIQTIRIEKDIVLSVVLKSSQLQLDDIVVTSDKKEENGNRSSSSITILQAKEIRDYRIWEIKNLSGISPNLSLAHSGDNRNVASIRGIATTSYEQSIATYIDGVSQFNLDTYLPQLNDIERIEILRGPQGTFYGRNAMGGVLNIITKKPSNVVSGSADVQIGSYGQKRATASFKAPLIQNKLFLGISALWDKRDGYYYNEFIQSKFDKQEQKSFGLQLKYLMNKGWSVSADVKGYQGKNNGAFPLVNDLTSLFENPYRLSQNATTTMNDATGNASLVVRHKGNKMDFTFQTARQHNKRFYTNQIDGDFSLADVVSIFNNYGKDYNTVKAWTQEVRLSSAPDDKKKIQWNVGGYQFIQESPNKQATVFGEDAGLFGIPDKNFSLISTNIAKNNGIAGYGHLTYTINPKVSFNAGLRLDYEKRKLSIKGEYEKQPFGIFTTQPDTSGSTSYTAFSPKMGLVYQFDTQSRFYLNYSRGFRSGGLTGLASDPSQIPLYAFLPEYSNMFEAGIKGENSSKTFRYGFVLFLNTVQNIQAPRLILPDAITVISNAGRLDAVGAELELAYKPVKGLQLNYAGGFTDAQFKRLEGIDNGSQIDLSGNKQIFTPASTHFISGQYDFNLNKHIGMIRIEYNRSGLQYFDYANKISQAAYGLINVRAGVRTQHIEVFVWGRNLSNKKYIDYAYDFGAAHLGEPRTIGLGFGYRL